MRIQIALWSIILLGILGQSCIPNKKVVYLQPSVQSPLTLDSLIEITRNEYHLMIGDIISLDLRSSDPQLTHIFQPVIIGNAGGASSGDQNFLTGYRINEKGDIEIPYVGFVSVVGLTLEQTQKVLEEEISRFITTPYVLVRLGGINYTALGEFNGPGQKWLRQSSLTIFEAIANAGDLTILADRKAITLIRKYPEGIKRHEIDLTDESILTSSFYFIQPGDQLYAQPLPVRQLGVGITGFQTTATILSLVSSALVLFLTINRL